MYNNSARQVIELIDLQARMKMKAQINRFYLSYLWWFLEPVLFVAMFYMVFEFLLRRGGENFVVFLLIGKVIFMWFSKSVTMGSLSLRQNSGIIALRKVPKWLFPLISVQIATYRTFIAMAVLMSVLVMLGYHSFELWWQLIPLVVVTYLLVSSVTCFFSIMVGVAEDCSQLVSLFMIGMMFSSGVFWDVNDLSPKAAKIILIGNPLAGLIDSYRSVLMYGRPVEVLNLLSAVVVGIVLWSICLLILRKYNNQITRCIL